jgi:hypothetical protein
MVKEIFIKEIQPDGLRVGNKVNLMTFFSQSFSQFGGNYAAAAKCWVTHNANIHIFRIEAIKSL